MYHIEGVVKKRKFFTTPCKIRTIRHTLGKSPRKVADSLKKRLTSGLWVGIISLALNDWCAAMAQVVEHVLGKDEVTSSNLVSSSTKTP